MSRGRRAALIPAVPWKCNIPVDVAAQVDTLLLDPLRGIPEYGARSALVTQLLRAWLEAQRKAVSPTTEKE